jgi:hypothetical protein
MDDFQFADLVEQSVVCQKREVKLEAECGDPEVVSKSFAFFEGLRNSSDSRQNVSYADVKRDRIEIGRVGRSESIAAFASNASRSNCNVSPERFANGLRQVASSFLADCGPVATLGCDGPVKGDAHHLVVTHADERFGELEDLLFGDVFGFDRSAHVDRITM